MCFLKYRFPLKICLNYKFFIIQQIFKQKLLILEKANENILTWQVEKQTIINKKFMLLTTLTDLISPFLQFLSLQFDLTFLHTFHSFFVCATAYAYNL